jgi:hypothetical protein
MNIYVDGQLDGSTNGPTGDISYRDGRSTSFSNDPFIVIGAEKHDVGSEYPSFSGWLDDVHLSNVIRYNSNFSRPSAPFTTDSNTVALYHLDEGPAGPCNSTVLDSSNAIGGPSNGTCNYGGSNPAGPVYTNDTPFNTNTPTNTISSSPTSTATTPPSYTNKVYLPLVVWGQAVRVQVVQPTATTTPTDLISPTTNPPTTSNPICGFSGMIVFFIVALYLLWIR